MSDLISGRASVAKITWLTATSIVVADMVGVGVFTSLGFQVKDITSGFALLALWIVGGVVAMCGAICYAELALMFPRSSGEYNFLRRIYHPAFGFMAGFLSATVGFAAPTALAAMAFGVYFKSIMPGVPPLLPGLAVVWIISLVHLRGMQYGSAFQNLWTALKLLLIVGFLAAGLLFGDPQPISFAPSASDLTFITSVPFAISLVFVMYSYSGWNAATYIIGEIQEPNRSLPRALFLGTLIVIGLYVGLNAVFLTVTPIQELAGQLDVAMIAGTLSVRRGRRPHRRHADLPRPRLLDQRDDVDRSARHHDDGRGHAAAARLLAALGQGRAGERHHLPARRSRPCCSPPRATRRCSTSSSSA